MKQKANLSVVVVVLVLVASSITTLSAAANVSKGNDVLESQLGPALGESTKSTTIS